MKRPVLLYLAVPEALEYGRRSRSLKGAAKAAVLRVIDRFRQAVLRRDEVFFDAWDDWTHTNRGDAAIRMAIRMELGSIDARGAFDFLEVAWGDLTDAHIATLNEGDGVFVIAGSGYLHFSESHEIPRRIISDLALVRRMTGRKIAFGIGVNQYSAQEAGAREFHPGRIPPDHAEVVRELLQQLDAVSVRDRNARDVVTGIAGRTCNLTGDPVLFLPTHLDLGPPPARVAGSPVVGLNIALHGPNSARLLPMKVENVRRIMSHLEDRYGGVSFRYFVHSEAEAVVFGMLARGRHNVTAIRGDVPNLLANYRGLDVHVCEMLHSSIMSISVGVPTLNLAYDIKNSAFFRLLDIPWSCIPMEVGAWKKGIPLVDRLLAERDSLSSHLVSKRRELEAAEQAFLQDIASTL